MGRPDLNRRHLLATAGGLAVAGSLAFAALGTGADALASGADTRVRYWNLFSGGDGANMIAMLDAFREEHPGIDVKDSTLQWGNPFYTKLAMAAAGNHAPDLGVMHMGRVAGFSPGRLLDPWDEDLLAKYGVRKADYNPALWNRGVIDGKLYAVPLDQHPFVLYYNLEICKKAGLLGPDNKIKTVKGVTAFLDMLRAVKETTGKYAVSVDTTSPWRLWYTLYGQLEGEFFSPDGTELVIDDAKALEALDLIAKLASEGLTPRSANYAALVAQFTNVDAGMSFNGEWEVTTYQTAKLPFSMAPFPVVYDVPKFQGDSHTFVLPHQARRNADDTKATIEYIAWMLKHSVGWAAGGHIPAYQPVARSAEYQALKPQSNYAGIPAYLNYDPDAWFTGAGSDFQNYFAENVQNVFLGSGDPAAGFDGFVARLNKLLDRPQPV